MESSRFDRQIRLWGEEGQNRLERASCCICLVTPTTIEAAKNLILAGIGFCTIIDDGLVENELQNNSVFVSPNFQSKARAAQTFLSELNENTHLDIIETDPSLLAFKDLQNFDLVIWACSQPFPFTNINAVIVNGKSISINYRSHLILGGDIGNQTPLLWLDRPFSELFDLTNCLYNSISSSDGLPIIIPAVDLKRKNPQWSYDDFRVEFSKLGYSEKQISPCITWMKVNSYDRSKCLLNDFIESLPLEKDPKIQVLVQAAINFIKENDGLMSVSDEVPDMEASTEFYCALKNVYHQRLEKDAAKLLKIISELRDTFPVTIEEVKSFIRQLSRIKLVSSNKQLNSHGDASDDPVSASIIGGLVSQEALKLLTRTFLPLSGQYHYENL